MELKEVQVKLGNGGIIAILIILFILMIGMGGVISLATNGGFQER